MKEINEKNPEAKVSSALVINGADSTITTIASSGIDSIKNEKINIETILNYSTYILEKQLKAFAKEQLISYVNKMEGISEKVVMNSSSVIILMKEYVKDI